VKRTAFALTLILALLFSAVAGIQFVSLAADIFPPAMSSSVAVFILSPENKTYNPNNVSLKINVVYVPGGAVLDKNISYSVDGQDAVHIEPIVGYEYSLALVGLSDGSHRVTVVATMDAKENFFKPVPYEDTRAYGAGDTVYFTVDSTPPKVTVLSLENKTFNTSSLQLNFTVSEPVSRMAYSVDGQKNTQIYGNMTLPELSYGSYNLTLYATDKAGNTGASETIIFSIAKEQVSEPFPTIWIVVAIAGLVAVIYAGIIFYCKKRKRQREGKGE